MSLPFLPLSKRSMRIEPPAAIHSVSPNAISNRAANLRCRSSYRRSRRSSSRITSTKLRGAGGCHHGEGLPGGNADVHDPIAFAVIPEEPRVPAADGEVGAGI